MKAAILTASTMKKSIDGKVFSGKCITGFDLDSNRIVRFVGNSKGAPMMGQKLDQFKLLDIVEVPFVEECPITCQTENVLGDYRNITILGKYEGGIETLYQAYRKMRDKEKDPSFMRNRSYKLDDITPYKHSLELIKVEDLKVFIQENKSGKKMSKCSFIYKGYPGKYFSVTDPDYHLVETDVGDAYLAVSIPADSPEGIGYYKFVAAIYPIN